MTELLLALAWKVPLLIVLMHFGEWAVHKYILHGLWLLKVPFFNYIPRWHAQEHHGMGKNEWHHINLSPRDYFLALPFLVWGGIRFFHYDNVLGLAGVIAILICTTGHMLVWNKLHRAIHGLEPNNWTTKMPFYQTFKDHHDGHHIRPTRNFGVVFIAIDSLMGTKFTRKEPHA